MLGGGGGTFGIIISAVVKVHPKVPVTTSTWTVLTSETVSTDAFWELIRFFWDSFLTFNNAKTYSYGSLTKLAPGSYIWAMTLFFAMNKTIEEYEVGRTALPESCRAQNHAHSLHVMLRQLVPCVRSYTRHLQLLRRRSRAVRGPRIVPKKNWADEETREQTFAIIHNVVEKAMMLGLYHQHPAAEHDTGVNLGNPPFRNLQAQLVVGNTDMTPGGWKAGDDTLNGIMAPLRDVSPAGGTYGDEANVGSLIGSTHFGARTS